MPDEPKMVPLIMNIMTAKGLWTAPDHSLSQIVLLMIIMIVTGWAEHWLAASLQWHL